MHVNELRKWVSNSKKLDGIGKNILTARLVSDKTGWKQRYCNLILFELEREGLLQHSTQYVIDINGVSRPTKTYWKA